MLIPPKQSKKKYAFSLVEALLAISVFAVIVTVLMGALIYGQESTRLAGERSRGSILAEEGLEAMRNIRDASFANLTDGTHGFAITANQWAFSGTSDTIDTFTRIATISAVDSKRKDATISATWQQTPQRIGTSILATRLTNWTASVTVTASLEATFDLTAGNSGSGGTNGLSIFFANNKIYLGRANSAGSEFYIFDVSTPSAPTLLGQRDLNDNPNDIVVVGNYAYIASGDNSEELQIIDISVPADIALGGKLTTVDLTNANSGDNNVDALRITSDGSYLYMLRDGGDEFLIFDISSTPAAPGSPIGRSSAFTGSPTDIAVSGNYAYTTSDNNTDEFQVFDVTTKTAPSRVAVLNLNSGTDGPDALSVALTTNYAFVGRKASGGAPELYSIDISTPTTPTLSTTLEIGADVLSLEYGPDTGYLYLATDDSANDFKLVEALDPTSFPAVITQLNISNVPVQIAFGQTINRVFITSTENAEELQVIDPETNPW